MAKYRIRSVNDDWGGVINLNLDDTMSVDECINAYNQLSKISINNFCNINIYDIPTNVFFGKADIIYVGTFVRITVSVLEADGDITRIIYEFRKNGTYTRTLKTFADLDKLLSRLDAIEENLMK